LQEGVRKIQNTFGGTLKQKPQLTTTTTKPVGDIRYTDSFGKVETATADKSKAEALCDFFSSMFSKENKTNLISIYLENKNCTHASECPVFETDDIKTRLQKLNVTKSPEPDGIHPKCMKQQTK